MILTEYDEKEEREYLRRESRIEMLQEVVLETLEELGSLPEDIRQRIVATDDIEQLKYWNKLSMRAGSIEEFIKGM